MRCSTLENPNAREVLATVWRHLRAHFPADARFLAAIVKRIEPLPDEEVEDGTRGWWKPDETGSNFWLQSPEWQAWWGRLDRLFGGAEHGRVYGTMELPDDERLTAADVAHEMGHAFTSDDDLAERNAPHDEWASEAAADMHAVRWGLLTCESIRRRHADNVAAVAGQSPTCGSAWQHHGPPPGGDWFETDGARWRLREDFVFETVTE